MVRRIRAIHEKRGRERRPGSDGKVQGGQNLRHSEQLLVHGLERIDSLLEVDVVRGKLGL